MTCRCAIVRVSVIALLLLPTPSAFAFHHKETQGPATLEVRSDANAPTLALADVVHVVITIEGSKALRVEAPPKPTVGANWDVLTNVADTAGPPTKEAIERRRWRQTLTLAPAMPGELTLELTPLIVRDSGREERVAFKPLPLVVQTQIKDVDPRQARDITATEELPPPPDVSRAWLWLAALPVVLAAAAGLWFVLGRRAPRPPATALQKALRECDRLAAMQLPEKDQTRAFVILVSGIVRRYLERRFDLPARRRTTAELMASIAACKALDEETRRWLRDFVTAADLVKFAGGAVSADRCRDLLAQVRQFCRTTFPDRGERR